MKDEHQNVVQETLLEWLAEVQAEDFVGEQDGLLFLNPIDVFTLLT